MALLRNQNDHRSLHPIKDVIDYHHNFNNEELISLIVPYLQKSGLYKAATIGKFKVDPTLVITMVES